MLLLSESDLFVLFSMDPSFVVFFSFSSASVSKMTKVLLLTIQTLNFLHSLLGLDNKSIYILYSNTRDQYQ